MTFSQKLINISFSGQGLFPQKGGGTGNTTTITNQNNTGLRITCKIDKTGGPVAGLLSAAVYGLPLDQMNQMTILGTDYRKKLQNKVILEAGDTDTGMSKVFTGKILTAFIDGLNQPQVCFRIMALAGGAADAVTKSEDTSIAGDVSAREVMSKLADKLDLTLEDHTPADIKLDNPHLPGSYISQIKDVAGHAGWNYAITNDKLIIGKLPAGSKNSSIVLTPGVYIRYPSFNQSGIVLQTIFLPNLEFLTKITVKGSEFTAANGTWTIYHLDYDLETQIPNGQWCCNIEAVNINTGAPSTAGSSDSGNV